MAKEYDLVVLGGGPGGYVAAIRASQLGFQVAIVESGKLGGTCLHHGCIPSKALLGSAERYRQMKEAEDFGIDVGEFKLNFSRIQERKAGIVSQLHHGVEHLMKQGKIDVIQGFGRILGPSIFSPQPGTISIEHEDGRENTMITPKYVLIATGSKPKTLPGLDIDGNKILTSEEALELEALPESMLIVGGGVIGVEWASMLADFGVDVTILEYADRILPGSDHAVSNEVKKQLKKRGVTIMTSAKVLADSVKKDEKVVISAEVKGERKDFSADKMLVSVGREANIHNIGLENTSIRTEQNVIQTNDFYQTKESHIYAIGDVIGGMQLAHVASREGVIAVEHMAGRNPDKLDYLSVPSCIYSSPEAASVGYSEQEAKEKGYAIKTGQFAFRNNGKAMIHGETSGFIKIITDEKTADLLGVHIVGPHASDLISEAALAKLLDATAWEISESIHAHPSLSEVMGEAALAVEGRQIHS